MSLHFTRTNKSRARQRFVALWLLLALLQQAMFATGTMAGSAANGGSWITLCTGSSDVAKLVYIGDSEQDASHTQAEQCVFSAGVLANSYIPSQFIASELSSSILVTNTTHTCKASQYFKLPRAPPTALV